MFCLFVSNLKTNLVCGVRGTVGDAGQWAASRGETSGGGGSTFGHAHDEKRERGERERDNRHFPLRSN